jgi:HAD superfamily hydrolase (TIGR01509 family)
LADRAITGTVETGRQEAAGFLGVPWVDEQLREKLGFCPFPGTLNLRLRDAESLETWRRLQSSIAPVRLASPDTAFCDASCYPVLVNGEVPGAIVLPLVDDYYRDVVEVVAAEGLRMRFRLKEGDECSLTVRESISGAPPSVQRVREAVLFDFEGTLVDFQWSLAAAEAELRAVLSDLGFDLTPFVRDNYAVLRSRALDLASSDDVRHRIEARFGEIYDRYDRDALTRWSLQRGAQELLQGLRTAGVRLALISNVGRLALGDALARLGLSTAFDAVVTRNDVGRAKPSGEGLRKALSLLHADPDRAMMVGDSLSDLFAARDAGVEVAILLGGENPPELIHQNQPDHVISCLNQVFNLLATGDAEG